VLYLHNFYSLITVQKERQFCLE